MHPWDPLLLKAWDSLASDSSSESKLEERLGMVGEMESDSMGSLLVQVV